MNRDDGRFSRNTMRGRGFAARFERAEAEQSCRKKKCEMLGVFEYHEDKKGGIRAGFRLDVREKWMLCHLETVVPGDQWRSLVIT